MRSTHNLKKIFLMVLTFTNDLSNPRGRFFQILRVSQKVRTLTLSPWQPLESPFLNTFAWSFNTAQSQFRPGGMVSNLVGLRNKFPSELKMFVQKINFRAFFYKELVGPKVCNFIALGRTKSQLPPYKPPGLQLWQLDSQQRGGCVLYWTVFCNVGCDPKKSFPLQQLWSPYTFAW